MNYIHIPICMHTLYPTLRNEYRMHGGHVTRMHGGHVTGNGGHVTGNGGHVTRMHGGHVTGNGGHVTGNTDVLVYSSRQMS